MSELWLPLSLAVELQSHELQSHDLRLDSSLWTAHHTNGGYSVSFFWPSPCYKRRQPRKPQNSCQAISNVNNPPCGSHSVTYMSGPPPKSSKSLTPSNAHLNKKGILQPSQLLQQVMKILLFPLVMNQRVLKKTSMNLLLNPLGQAVSS